MNVFLETSGWVILKLHPDWIVAQITLGKTVKGGSDGIVTNYRFLICNNVTENRNIERKDWMADKLVTVHPLNEICVTQIIFRVENLIVLLSTSPFPMALTSAFSTSVIFAIISPNEDPISTLFKSSFLFLPKVFVHTRVDTYHSLSWPEKSNYSLKHSQIVLKSCQRFIRKEYEISQIPTSKRRWNEHWL